MRVSGAVRRRLLAVQSRVRRKPDAHHFFATNAPPRMNADAPLVFGSCICREAHYRLPLFRWWSEALRERPKYHRKLWEYVYICHALHERGLLKPGARGLGFGVGKEPLAALFASRGAEILATDMDSEAARKAGWLGSEQHADAELDALNDRGICDVQRFRTAVRYRSVDMNAIPPDLVDFDFCWSSCAYEHLGSLDQGMAFVRNSMKVLRRGGVAVHTTEFNISSNDSTASSGPTVLFRRRDFEALQDALMADGHNVAPFDFQTGNEPAERYVDLPPFGNEPHLRLHLPVGLAGYDTTSIGVIVVKG